MFFIFFYYYLTISRLGNEVMTQYIKEVHFFFYINENFSEKDS